ncbi:MAG TPA: MBL fold metallo-hydrolase [Solirubrobacteraceae bacterium]|nr:MBL fold metallo-hydrolase [Solirubrobacteraceae bacterium]
MRKPTRRTETGRGERVLPGVWRLRLPLPWAVVPHCNAWALARADGIVLVDCGMATAGSLRDLERALEQVGLALEDVRLLVCTHAHIDHCGQASAVQERSGCELWIHPRHEHLTASLGDREAALARRIEIARQSGVPEAPLLAWAEGRRDQGTGMSGPLAVARDLLPGVVVGSDRGDWHVYETPGHAPSHVVLHQPEHRLLLSGDHVLGRISLYFDHGWTPDPVGEFLASLDVVDALDVRLTLSGHGRPFTDLGGHVDGNRALVRERLDGVLGSLHERGEAAAFDLLPAIYGDKLVPETAAWLLTKMLCYLEHLERTGRLRRLDGEPVRWAAA